MLFGDKSRLVAASCDRASRRHRGVAGGGRFLVQGQMFDRGFFSPIRLGQPRAILHRRVDVEIVLVPGQRSTSLDFDSIDQLT